MSLETGKIIHGNKWIRMKIKDKVINKVHQLAESEGQPWIHKDPFTINWSQNIHENDIYDVGVLVNEEETSSMTNEDDTEKSIEIIEENI